MAGTQQAGELIRVPIGVGDESGSMAEPLHVQILPEHVRVDAAELELGFELGINEIAQMRALEAEQPERKQGIDLVDVHLAGAARVLRARDSACMRCWRKLKETFGQVLEMPDSA